MSELNINRKEIPIGSCVEFLMRKRTSTGIGFLSWKTWKTLKFAFSVEKSSGSIAKIKGGIILNFNEVEKEMLNNVI